MTSGQHKPREGITPVRRQRSDKFHLPRHERVCRQFGRIDSEEERRRVDVGVAERLADVADPGEHERCAAFYAAAREVDAALWAAETRWEVARRDAWLWQCARYLLEELPAEQYEVFVAMGLLDAVSTSRVGAPRADIVAGAVYFRSGEAIRQRLSRLWSPVKERSAALAETRQVGAGAGDLYDRIQVQRFFLPEITAEAWRVTDDLLEAWIGEESAVRVLDAYHAHREHVRKLLSARQRLARAPEDLVMFVRVDELEELTEGAWDRLQKAVREFEEFFRAAGIFQELVASLGGRPKVE